MNYCHKLDKTWNPRPLPNAYGEIAENYANAGEARHLADGWRVAVPYVDEPGYRHDSVKSTVMFGDTHATEMPGALINIADEQADQAKADEAARKEAEAAEDARVLALPSIAAIVAKNVALETDLKAAQGKLAAAEKELAAMQAKQVAVEKDVADLKAAAVKPK